LYLTRVVTVKSRFNCGMLAKDKYVIKKGGKTFMATVGFVNDRL